MTIIERNEVFELAYRFVTETSENIFLTGKAGTGKTTFLKYLKNNCAKNIIIAAPTGVAAINAGGVTLHSLFQLPFHPFLPVKASKDELLGKIRYNKQRQQLLRKMELLIIDEISMVRCDVMDAIDTVLRAVRRNYHLPFGGVQLLCIGDLHQLTPVVTKNEWPILQEYYASPFFFDSIAIKEQMPLLIELNKVYRQKEDSFVSLLNKVRNNIMMPDDLEDLHARYNPMFRPRDDEHYITLTTHNNQADQINRQELQKLFSPEFTFKAVVEGDFPEHIYPAEAELVLKEGAQVMFLKNDPVFKRYFNGKIGVVKTLEKDKLVVDCDGADIEVVSDTWENTRYTLNRSDGKLEQELIGSFSQYPLRLAWAITIHKSQGLTFEKLMIDAGEAFSSGQVYVALSRCTSLEGIVLLSKIQASAIYNNDHVIKGQQALTHKGSLAERFVGARSIYTQQLMEEIFSFTDVATAVDVLQFHIKDQKDRLNEGAVEWIDELKISLLADKDVGERFMGRVTNLLKEEHEIEKNGMLQKRINDAAGHFEPKFSAYLSAIQKHPLVTEHKETAMLIDGYLQQSATALHIVQYFLQYCKLAFSVTSFLQHKIKLALPRFNITCYASAKDSGNSSNSDSSNVELYDTLKRWRDHVVSNTGQPIFMVANQATLKEIATYLPLTKKDLLQISGFGKAKVDKYGDDILETVEGYCSRHGIETNMFAKVENPKKERNEKSTTPKIDTKAESLKLYKTGLSITAIAKERALTSNTIETHLAYYIELGKIDIKDLVTEEKQKLIKDAATIHGWASHKTLIENLPQEITYGEIKMVLAAEKSK